MDCHLFQSGMLGAPTCGVEAKHHCHWQHLEIGIGMGKSFCWDCHVVLHLGPAMEESVGLGCQWQEVVEPMRAGICQSPVIIEQEDQHTSWSATGDGRTQGVAYIKLVLDLMQTSGGDILIHGIKNSGSQEHHLCD